VLGGWIPVVSEGGLWLLAALAGIGIFLDVRLGGLRLPSVKRQVNDAWMYRYRGWVYGTGFGLQLGAGVVTIVAISAVYSTFAAALLSRSIASGALIGGLFGFARAATIFAGMRVRTPRQVIALDGRIASWDVASRRAALVAEVALVVVAVLAAASVAGG
jgi:hypothetical protein